MSLVFVLLFGFHINVAAPVQLNALSRAHDLKSGALKFSTRQQERWEGDRQLSFSYESFDANKRLIYKREHDGRRRTVHSTNVATGAESWAEIKGQSFVMRSRKSGSKEIKTKTKTPGLRKLYLPSEVMTIVHEHWDKILAGERIEFAMAAPERLDWFRFRLYKTKRYKTSDGRAAMELRFEPESRMLRLFTGQMLLGIDLKSRGMIEYKGRTSQSTSDGSTIKAHIVFDGRGAGALPSSQKPAAAQ